MYVFCICLCVCSVKIAAGAVVCVESEIRGDVTIGKLFPPFLYVSYMSHFSNRGKGGH